MIYNSFIKHSSHKFIPGLLILALLMGSMPVPTDAAVTTIRQEINILAGETMTSSGTLESQARVQLDTTNYAGTVLYYFEAVHSGASNNSGTIKLSRAGTSTYDASIDGAPNSTTILTRSTAFNPPAGQTEYTVTLVGDSSNSQTVKAARIIIIQTETPLTTTQTQIEIGNAETGKSNITAAALSAPKYWKYTAANWDGGVTFYAEATYKSNTVNVPTVTDIGTTGTWVAPEGVTSVDVEAWGGGGAGGSVSGNPAGGGGGGGGAYSKATIAVTPLTNYTVTVGAGGTTVAAAGGNPGGNTWFKSTSDVLAIGGEGGGGGSINSLLGAGGLGGLASAGVGTIKFNGGDGIDGNAGGTGGAGGGAAGTGADGGDASGDTGGTGGAGNPSTGTGANSPAAPAAGIAGSIYGGAGSGGKATTNTDRLGGVGAAGAVRISYASGTTTEYPVTIKLQESDGTGDGFTGWTDKVTIVNAAAANTPTRIRSTAFTPTDGRNYRIVSSISNSAGTYNIYNGKIIVDTASEELSSAITKTLDTGENSAISIVQDANYVYTGTNTAPAKVVRISKSDFSTTTTKTLASGESNAFSLVSDDNYIYAGTNTAPAKVVRISKSDFSTTTTKTLASGENYALSMTSDANYVYVGANTTPAQIIRISKSDFSTTTTKTLASGENGIRAITEDDNYIYVGTNQAPAQIIRISKSDFSTTTTKTLASGEDNARAMADDTNYVYVGLDTTPAKIVRISKSDFSTTTTKTLASGENYVNSMTSDNSYVYAGTNTTPAKVVRISKSDFSTTTTKTLASGENTAYSMTSDETYIYTGTLTTPGRVARIKIAATYPTKLEPQYLLANTMLASGTSLQKSLTKWDSTEWSGVENTYTFAVDSTDVNSTNVELDTSSGTLVTGSSIAGPSNQGVSGALTMPATGNLDLKVASITPDLGSTDMAADANLVAYYKLEDTADSKGTYTLTNANSVSFSTGKFGNGANMGSSNTSKYLYNGTNLGISSTQNTSISLWVKLNDEINTTDVWTLTMLGNATGGYFQTYYRYNPSAAYRLVQMDSGGNGPTWQSVSPLALGTTNWYHVVIVRNNTASTSQVYVNGSLYGSAGVGTGTVGSSFLSIGAQHGSPASNLSSSIIDDVAVFNKPLTATDVSNIYASTASSNVAIYGARVLVAVAPIPPVNEYTQAAYRIFDDPMLLDVGSALAAQNTAATLGSRRGHFRMRVLMGLSGLALGVSGATFKLQYATKVGTCDTSFIGETYEDVTTNTVIAFYDNSNLTDGSTFTTNGGDPTDGARPIVNQTYVESNNFTNSQGAVAVGSDGMWDISLYDKSASSNTSYCIRIVKSDGSLLDTYTVIPEIVTAIFRSRGGGGNNTEASATPSAPQTGGTQQTGGSGVESGDGTGAGTCADGIQNGNETGVDTGGRCGNTGGGQGSGGGDLGWLRSGNMFASTAKLPVLNFINQFFRQLFK